MKTLNEEIDSIYRAIFTKLDQHTEGLAKLSQRDQTELLQLVIRVMRGYVEGDFLHEEFVKITSYIEIINQLVTCDVTNRIALPLQFQQTDLVDRYLITIPSYRQRFLQMLDDIHMYCHQYDIPDKVYRTCLQLIVTHYERMTKYASTLYTTGILYIAMEIHREPFFIEEFCERRKTKLKHLTNIRNVLYGFMEIRPIVWNAFDYIGYVQKLFDFTDVDIDLYEKLVAHLYHIFHQYHPYCSKHSSPTIIAASITYMVCRISFKSVNQKNIADAFKITEVTLREHFHTICTLYIDYDLHLAEVGQTLLNRSI